jgi:hypothetical protein
MNQHVRTVGCQSPKPTPYISTTLIPIEAAVAVIESLPPKKQYPYLRITAKYGVERTTLA